MAFYEVRDIRVNVQSHGEGFPLIGIMGLGANSDYWSPDFIAGISKTRRFILVDNRGAGDTSRGTKPMSFAVLADDLKALRTGTAGCREPFCSDSPPGGRGSRVGG